MKMIIKKRKENINPSMGIEPTDQNAYGCESSVLTIMLERMLLFSASYDKYILSRSITQKFSILYSEFRFLSIANCL